MYKIIVLVFLVFYFSCNNCLNANAVTNDNTKLARGETITRSLSAKSGAKLKGSEAKIMINAPAEEVWKVIDNQENLPTIIPKVKKVKVIEKTANSQKVETAIKVSPFLPMFKYTLLYDQSEKYRRIKFNKIAGCFNKLYGSFEMEPCSNGTILTYRMFIDTGFPVPDFVGKNGLKKDIPEMLSAIKQEAERNS